MRARDRRCRCARSRTAWQVEPNHVYRHAAQRDADPRRRPLQAGAAGAARGRCASRSTASSSRSPRPTASRPSASSSPAPAATARSACARVKGQGGLTMAQAGGDICTTACRAARLRTGVVDYVLPVADMPASSSSTCGISRASPAARTATARASRPPTHLAASAPCCAPRTGHDFVGYKDKTVARRVQRRMQVLQIADRAGVRRAAAQGPQEVAAAVPRPADRRHQLLPRSARRSTRSSTTVIPQLFEGKGADDTVRVWVPGCATGEEAYSIAILLREHMRRCAARPKLQIFATDIDEQALAVARARPLSARPSHGVSAERGSSATSSRERRHYRDRQGAPRDVRVLGAQRDPRPAVLAARPDLLPQPADLPRAASCRSA